MIWIGLLILGAVIVAGTYLIATFEVGSRIALFRLPYVAGAVVGGLGLYMMIRRLPQEWENYAWAGFSLFFATYVAALVWRAIRRNARAGNVMLDLGRPRGGDVFGIVGLVATLYPDVEKSQEFGWQGGPKTGAGIVLEYVSEPVAGPTPPWRACAISL